MSHTTAFVLRSASLGARHSRGAKRLVTDADTDRKAHGTRVRASRPSRPWKKPKTSAAPASLAALSPCTISPPSTIILEVPPYGDPSLTISDSSLVKECRSTDADNIHLGGEIGADASLPLNASYEPLDILPDAMDGRVSGSRKRRAYREDETEDSTYLVQGASPAKKARTVEPSPEILAVPEDASNGSNLPKGGESSSIASPHLQVPEDDRMPTASELGVSPPSTGNEARLSFSHGFVPPSHLSRWQSPSSSPLGPCTAPYRRRSRISPVPKALSPNPAKGPLIRNMFIDAIMRNPYEQSPQWCEDLHAMGLSERLHPSYICTHDYHPSDPEYDEEWSRETFSEAGYSDDEDDIFTPAGSEEDPAEASVTIVGAEEGMPAQESRMFTFMDWRSWHPPIPVPSHTLDIHPPLICPWDTAKSLHAGTKSKAHCDSAFGDNAELFPTA